MDSVSRRTPKNSSNISELFLQFSKLSKLRSFGVPSTVNPKPTIDSHTESSEDNGDPKIYPQPLDEAMLEEATILELFTVASALKSAYVQLQRAHVPYEPRKIQVADELMVSELDSLSKFEVLYAGKQRSKPKSRSSLCLEIQEHHQLIEELESRMQAKENEILRLRQEVEELDRKNAELEEKIKQKLRPEQLFSLLNREWTPRVFSVLGYVSNKYG